MFCGGGRRFFFICRNTFYGILEDDTLLRLAQLTKLEQLLKSIDVPVACAAGIGGCAGKQGYSLLFSVLNRQHTLVILHKFS